MIYARCLNLPLYTVSCFCAKLNISTLFDGPNVQPTYTFCITLQNLPILGHQFYEPSQVVSQTWVIFMINKKLPEGGGLLSPTFRLSSANESVGCNGDPKNALEKDDIAYLWFLLRLLHMNKMERFTFCMNAGEHLFELLLGKWYPKSIHEFNC